MLVPVPPAAIPTAEIPAADIPPADIPPAVRHADAVHHAILERVPFSRHLNPLNAPEARRAFLAGRSPAPPFRYQPLSDAEDLLRELDAAEPPRDHPAGALVGACMDGTRLVIEAIRHRTEAAFDAMARAGGWYPDAELLALRFPPGEEQDEPFDISAQTLVQHLGAALVARGMDGWTIERDVVMAARVLVDGAKRLLRVNPDARFRSRDLERLVVHEIDVHAWRTRNGAAQALRCFETGLPGSLATEEGLAMLAEQHAGLSAPGVMARQAEVVHAIDLGRRAGFRDVYQDLAWRVGPNLAWGICLRIKRGLARPDLPGVYAKDSVYLAGMHKVGGWLQAGGDLRHLYVGKVGIDDPVERWLEQGWVRLQPMPALWSAPPAPVSPPGSAGASSGTPP